MLHKIQNSDGYKTRWEKVNRLFDAFARQEIKPGPGVRVQNTSNKTILEHISPPLKAEYASYDGPFCCKLSIEGNDVIITDPAVSPE